MTNMWWMAQDYGFWDTYAARWAEGVRMKNEVEESTVAQWHPFPSLFWGAFVHHGQHIIEPNKDGDSSAKFGPVPAGVMQPHSGESQKVALPSLDAKGPAGFPAGGFRFMTQRHFVRRA